MPEEEQVAVEEEAPAEQQYYEEEAVEEEEEEEESSGGTWWSMDHYEDLTPGQYGSGFGIAFAMMFLYMLCMLLFTGKWAVSAAPLVLQYQFNNPRTIPVTICMGCMLLCSIGAWGAAFLGFGLNYFELPPCKIYVTLANLVNLFVALLILFVIAYCIMLTLQYEIIRNAFTYYNWEGWKSRSELSRLPNGQQCSSAGPQEKIQAQRLICAERTFDYLEGMTIGLCSVGLVLGLVAILAIWKPAFGGEKNAGGAEEVEEVAEEVQEAAEA